MNRTLTHEMGHYLSLCIRFGTPHLAPMLGIVWPLEIWFVTRPQPLKTARAWKRRVLVL